MTRYHTRMLHIDHIWRLNVDSGLAAFLSNMPFDLYILSCLTHYAIEVHVFRTQLLFSCLKLGCKYSAGAKVLLNC